MRKVQKEFINRRNNSYQNNVQANFTHKQRYQSQNREASKNLSLLQSNIAVIHKNLILISKKQRGNPLIKHLQYSKKFEDELNDQNEQEMFEDYLINKQTSALYLSLKYHIAYPQYISGRLKVLYNEKRNSQRILLLKIDINEEKLEDCSSLNQIYTDCMLYQTTCILCWSDEEAAQYILTFKQQENKTDAQLQGNFGTKITKNEYLKLQEEGGGIQEQKERKTFYSCCDKLSSIMRLNKNDARNLMENYGSIKNIVLCDDYNKFLLIDGIGPSKVESLLNCFKGNFNENSTKLQIKKIEKQNE